MGTKDLCYSMNYISISFKHFDWTSWRLHIFRNFWFINVELNLLGGWNHPPKNRIKWIIETKENLFDGCFCLNYTQLSAQWDIWGTNYFHATKCHLSFFKLNVGLLLLWQVWFRSPHYWMEVASLTVVMSITMKTYFFFFRLSAFGSWMRIWWFVLGLWFKRSKIAQSSKSYAKLGGLTSGSSVEI